ncbi:MAG: ATP-binding cassette domain-containing protein [Lewinellaceae bacterium]|nr:ATP-binding cassette domain-containing protein [Lewinellaceae bacterium]
MPVTRKQQPVIVVRDLCKAFGDNIVLDRVNLTLYTEENLVVLGRSGSGKSVLIKCIIGLMEPDSGSIEVLGKNVQNLNKLELDQLRARVGFLFQSNALYDSMTVRENLEFPLRRHWLVDQHTDVNALVEEALDNVGLLSAIDLMPSELSGGMRKRIALARTLILKPEIILYDEPTTGLDPITGREILLLMNDVRRKYHSASLIITHDRMCIKITADRIVLLHNGQCYAEGTYEALKNSEDPIVKNFFQ